jgi:mannitol/fructose-specific phosphotransferase system IIA component (Ntr-type)
MDLGDILSKAQIIPDLRAKDRWEAIDELIENLVVTGKIQPGDRDAVTAAVKKRETSMSTGIGFGIGIPHASTDLIYEVVGALGRSKPGVNFDALDNSSCFFSCPRASSRNISIPWPTSPSSSINPISARRSNKPPTPTRCSTSSRNTGKNDRQFGGR